MRLIGFERDGVRHIGRVEDDRVADLGEIRAYYEAVARGEQPEAGEQLDRADLVEAPLVPETSRIFCVGVNYHSHADETKELTDMDLPEFPMIFGRWAQSLSVDGTEIPVPPNEDGLDWEVEMAVIIKDKVFRATRADALDHVLGYSAFNDVSARRKQTETTQFTLGKNADLSGVIGPVLVTADELPAGGTGLQVQTRVNGAVMQDSNTDLLIHDVARIIEYITDTVTLLPGDVIASGTPGGVGIGRKPPVLLNPGDVVEVEIEQIGILRNTFRSR